MLGVPHRDCSEYPTVSTRSSEPRQDRVIPLAGGADSAGEWIYVSTAEARARVGLPLLRSLMRGTVFCGIPCRMGYRGMPCGPP